MASFFPSTLEQQCAAPLPDVRALKVQMPSIFLDARAFADSLLGHSGVGKPRVAAHSITESLTNRCRMMMI